MCLEDYGYIPCEGCAHNNQKCDLVCEVCRDYYASDAQKEFDDNFRNGVEITDEELPF